MKQTIIITGHIPVKKNKWKYARNGHVYKPQECVDFEDNVRDEVLVQRIRNIDDYVKEGIEIQATFLTGGKERDLDGLLTTVVDALQDAGVFENDKMVNRYNNVFKHHVKERTPKEEKATITIIAL